VILEKKSSSQTLYFMTMAVITNPKVQFEQIVKTQLKFSVACL